MAIDPVCKMEVDEKTAKFKSEYHGKNYYFCAPGCKKKFEDNPEKYIDKEKKYQPPTHGCC
ncbi:MAG: YHS domain-containing protein [Candidatus Caldatribacteriota bacterium]